MLRSLSLLLIMRTWQCKKSMVDGSMLKCWPSLAWITDTIFCNATWHHKFTVSYTGIMVISYNLEVLIKTEIMDDQRHQMQLTTKANLSAKKKVDNITSIQVSSQKTHLKMLSSKCHFVQVSKCLWNGYIRIGWKLTHWPLGDLDAILKMEFSSHASDECHRTLLMIKSTLVQVMAWCHQATSHYLSQGWLSSLSHCGIARPKWVKQNYSHFTSIFKTRNLRDCYSAPYKKSLVSVFEISRKSEVRGEWNFVSDKWNHPCASLTALVKI